MDEQIMLAGFLLPHNSLQTYREQNIEQIKKVFPLILKQEKKNGVFNKKANDDDKDFRYFVPQTKHKEYGMRREIKKIIFFN